MTTPDECPPISPMSIIDVGFTFGEEWSFGNRLSRDGAQVSREQLDVLNFVGCRGSAKDCVSLWMSPKSENGLPVPMGLSDKELLNLAAVRRCLLDHLFHV